ncbi:MAG: hypothetical protein KGK03_00140 [Candidatus Omnitrophica bacterium]|nr:hypothetical protein [Candidatus Omnitrophota bacterium]MDE2221464.1 hypothetical protein [Candidatus Omnitrophota bacterium]
MHRSFAGQDGDTEHFLAITAPGNIDFNEQIKYVEMAYIKKIKSLGLTPQTAVCRRIFLSDILNQIDTIQCSPLAKESNDNPVAISIIQQPPLPYSRIALFAYHLESQKPLEKERLSSQHMLVRQQGLTHLFSTRICPRNTDISCSSGLQTQSVLSNLAAVLASQNGTLRDNCVRTWIYVKDIDIFYQEMVNERRKLFADNGLTADTHFIASSGIQGACSHRHDLIMLDAYSILGLAPEQITYLNDFKMLCPTKTYNVTFERGTKVDYPDRSQYFISGTASIDHQGHVLYPGNVLKQLDRTLANMEALLNSGESCLNDMMYLIVYLRDPADYSLVKPELSRRLPFVPAIIAQAPVCRPEWLVEIEGVAIKRKK